MADVYGFDPVAWSIDGGRHRGELLRVLAYAATGGTEGIVEAADCRVRQLAVAGPQVRIDAGALLIRNRSASVRNQTYVANGRVESVLDVPATGGSARSDLIVVRVEDPQYSPWVAPDPEDAPDYQYVKPFRVPNIGASITDATQLNLGYSAVALARVDVPPGTTNITDAMIKDLRQLAQPKRASFTQRYDGVTATSYDTNPAQSTWQRFPPVAQVASSSMAVPTWATSARIRVVISSIQLRTAGVHGWMRYGLHGGVPTTDVYTANTVLAEDEAGFSRITVEISSEVTIPAAMRGKTVSGYPEWQRRTADPLDGYLHTDGDVQVVVDVTWLERPE